MFGHRSSVRRVPCSLHDGGPPFVLIELAFAHCSAIALSYLGDRCTKYPVHFSQVPGRFASYPLQRFCLHDIVLPRGLAVSRSQQAVCGQVGTNLLQLPRRWVQRDQSNGGNLSVHPTKGWYAAHHVAFPRDKCDLSTFLL